MTALKKNQSVALMTHQRASLAWNQGESDASLQYDVERLRGCLDRLRLRLLLADFEDRRPFMKVKTTLLAATAMVLPFSVGAAKEPARLPPPSLVVAPSTSIAFSGPQGGPFSPPSIQLRLSASRGTVSYSIRGPSWLTASSTFGTTGTNGVTVTLTINQSAIHLPPGAYGPAVAFTNVSNGQGSATRLAKLVIQAPSGSAPPDAKSRGGRLLDGRGGYLLDDGARRLLAQ
jgi:hypothetical protein